MPWKRNGTSCQKPKFVIVQGKVVTNPSDEVLANAGYVYEDAVSIQQPSLVDRLKTAPNIIQSVTTIKGIIGEFGAAGVQFTEWTYPAVMEAVSKAITAASTQGVKITLLILSQKLNTAWEEYCLQVGDKRTAYQIWSDLITQIG